MENVSKNDAFRKDGNRKYGKRKDKSAWVENPSMEMTSAVLQR